MKIGNSFSSARIEIAVGLLATLMIAFGLFLYAIDEPSRIERAQAGLLQEDLDQAMTLYAENCAVCHGAAGEGIGATPALASEGLRGSDPAALEKVIERGLYGTAMPAWSLEDGGPLNDFQIAQLAKLIQSGDWGLTKQRVDSLGLAPLIPFASDVDDAVIESVLALPDGALLADGLQVYAGQCFACHGADGQGTSLAPALNTEEIRAKSLAEIERILLNGVPGTLMAAWEKTLSREQTDSILALIQRWDEIPAGAVPEPENSVPVTAESLSMGADLYAASCSSCHGPEGQGSQRAPSLNVKSFLTETNDLAIKQIITLGVPDTSMPAWGDRMLESEIEAIVGFIRSWEPDAPEVASPVRVRGPWWQSSSSAPNLPSGGMPSNNSQNGKGRGRQGWQNPQPNQGAETDPLGTGHTPGGFQSGNQKNPAIEAPATGLEPHAWGSVAASAETIPGSVLGIDWRILALVGSLLSLSGGLIVAGAFRFLRA